MFISRSILAASIECPLLTYTAKATIGCRFHLKNNGKEDYSVLKWSTPLEGVMSDCLTVTRNGKKLEYDGIYMKRNVPGPDEFLTVGAGQTLSSTFQVSDAFDMTKAGEYSVAIDTYLEYVVGSAASKPDIKRKIRHLSSPSVSFQIVGRSSSKGTLGQIARFLESRRQTKQHGIFDGTFGNGVSRKSVLPKPPVIDGGSPALRADTVKAHGDAFQTIRSFLAAPQTEELRILIMEWFGREKKSIIPLMGVKPEKVIVKKFQKMTNVLGNPKETITYTFDAPFCKENIYAYTFKDTRKIYLCQLYQQAALTGDHSKMGILTHELGHAIVKTDDIVYGQAACRILADQNPAKAVKNAESFEFFVEAL